MANRKTTDPRIAGGYGPKQISCPACSRTTRANANLCPACSYVFGPKDRRDFTSGGSSRGIRDSATDRRKSPRISKSAFMECMAQQGFKFLRHLNGFTGEVLREENDPQFEKLALQFESIPAIAEGIFITQTYPQNQISMPLDTFLELVGIRPERNSGAE